MGGNASSWITQKDFAVFFTTIAVLLGTGILGLPIKLTQTGFLPFLTLFTVTFALQVAIVYIHTDTLQRAQKHMHARLIAEHGRTAQPPQPDLHTMGKLYLTPWLSLLFDVAVLLTFVATLISYSLAGANAFSQLLGVSVTDLIIPFVGACTALIIFASGVVQPIISLLTFVKVVLLTFIIVTCTVVASNVRNPYHESWSDVMSPFLVGTVAIGGIADMMPVFYSFVRPTPRDIVHFRVSIILGITACYILNVVWGRAVLGIVPQTEADAAAAGTAQSLEAAGAAGDIATKPVIAIINEKFQQYSWVAKIVTAFITLSITVSFNAVGLGVKHVLDGMAVTLLRGIAGRLALNPRDVAELAEGMASAGGDAHGASPDATAASILASMNPMAGIASLGRTAATAAGRTLLSTRAALYVGCFGTTLGIALADPSGFITVLEVFVSMALNLAGGVLVVMMYVGVRDPPRGSLHRRALLAGGHGPLAYRAIADAAAAAAAAAADATTTDSGAGDEVSVPLTSKAGRSNGGVAMEALEIETADSASASAAAAAAFDAPDADDETIALPLNERTGAVLAVFCLVAFAIAVVYDVYSAGVNKNVFGPPTGGWIAACAVALFWRHALIPLRRWLRRGKAQVWGPPSANGSLVSRPAPRLQFVYFDESMGDGEREDGGEEEDGAADEASPGWSGPPRPTSSQSQQRSNARRGGAGRSGALLRMLSGHNFADEVVDVGVCLSAAWAATFEGCSLPMEVPLASGVAAGVLALHLVITPLLRRHCKARAQGLRLGVCALVVLLLIGLASLNAVCGSIGPSVVQIMLALYTLWATWYRLALRSPTDPLAQ